MIEAAIDVQPSTDLTTADVAQLLRYEAVIKRGLQTFVEVGNALVAIRDGELYRGTHGTFLEYCRERWDLGKSHVYRLMDAAGVAGNLAESSPMGEVSERVLRPLAKLEPDQQRDAWVKAVEDADGKPTAAHVEKAAATFAEPKPPKAKPEPVQHAAVWALETEVNAWLQQAGFGDLDVLLHAVRDLDESKVTVSSLLKRLDGVSYRKRDLIQAINNVISQRSNEARQASARAVYVEPTPKAEPEHVPYWRLLGAIRAWLTRLEQAGDTPLLALTVLKRGADSAYWDSLQKHLQFAEIVYRESDLPRAIEELYRWHDQIKDADPAPTVTGETAPPAADVQPRMIPDDLVADGYKIAFDPDGKMCRWELADGTVGDWWHWDDCIADARKRMQLAPPPPTPSRLDAVMADVDAYDDEARRVYGEDQPEVIEEVVPMIESGEYKPLIAEGFVLERKRQNGELKARWAWPTDGHRGTWVDSPVKACDQAVRWYREHMQEVEAYAQQLRESDAEPEPVELTPDAPALDPIVAQLIDPATPDGSAAPRGLIDVIREATVEQLQEALRRLPESLRKGRGPVLEVAIKKRGGTVEPPVRQQPDPRIEDAQVLIDLLIATRDTARAQYGELTGRHTDMLPLERAIASMLPHLESLLATLGGGE